MTTIPDHVGREAVRLLNADISCTLWVWPLHHDNAPVITVAKLLMDPPAPMTDPDEEAAKRVMNICFPHYRPTRGDLIRAGQLVAVADDAIERVAQTLAPNLEGGREFDQMPKDRAQLRQWTAQGMCLINDATQDDATWLAKEAITALAAKGTGDE